MPINPHMVQNAKAAGRVSYKAAFLSKAPFQVKTFNNYTKQNSVNPFET